MNIFSVVRGSMKRVVNVLTFSCDKCKSLIGTPLDDDEDDVTSAECPYCHNENEFFEGD